MMPSRLASLILAVALSASAPAAAQTAETAWSATPWLEDLAQIQSAMGSKYANIDWLTKDRGFDLGRAFERTAGQLKSAGSDAEARAIVDRLFVRISDGHAGIRWPSGETANRTGDGGSAPPQVANACAAMGYDARGTPGIAQSLPRYEQLPGDVLPAGTVAVRGDRLGVIRISEFDPHMAPTLCADAVRALKLVPDKPCDDICQDAILTWTYARLTGLLEERVRQLRSAGATLLMIDLSANGGGSEWAEAAARIVSPVSLTSARMGFVRGDHWVRHWAELAADLHKSAAKSKGAERQRLIAWAAEADRYRAQAADPCAAAASCPLVAQGPFSTGLVGHAKAGEFGTAAWAPNIFSIAQFPYHDSVWTGPLLVLVDDETWSAAEQFAALLQDNRAGVVIGSRTGGAGCGHTNGGTPTTLTNSKAVVELPDCARFRADGRNEVDGVIPDVLTGLRYRDGKHRKAALVMKHLPEAIARARTQRAATSR